MTPVNYRPPDLLHWFETGSQEAFQAAMRKGRALSKSASESSVKKNLVQAAGVAADFGWSAVAEIAHRKSEQTSYKLYQDKFTVYGGLGPLTVAYGQVTAIKAHARDKFTLEHPGGTITVKPVAHLVSGRIKVPVGWRRNDFEVPFTMLLEELSARCGLEIEPA